MVAIKNVQFEDKSTEIKVLKSLTDGSEEVQNLILSKVIEAWFTEKHVREIFIRITALQANDKPIPTSVALQADMAFTVNHKSILTGAVSPVTSVKDADALLTKLELLYKIRTTRSIATNIVASLKEDVVDEKELATIVTDIEENLTELKGTSQLDERTKHLGKGGNAKDLIINIVTSPKPDIIPTGFAEFDTRTGGISRTSLWALMSSSGGGKSILGMQCILNAYSQGFNVALIGFELSEEEYWTRILSNVSMHNNIDLFLRRLKNSHKVDVLNKFDAIQQFGEDNNCRLTVSTPPMTTSMAQIGAKFKDYDMIFIDMLGHVHLENGQRLQERETLGELARQAKHKIAVANNCVVLTAVQMNAEDTVKYSGAIKENCNWLWGWKYGEQERETGIITVFQDKARNAPIYDFNLKIDYDRMRVYSQKVDSSEVSKRKPYGMRPLQLDDSDLEEDDNDEL